MGGLEDRLRKLEEKWVLAPTVDEYLDASSRERSRALHALVERLAPHGFDGGHLFIEDSLRVLAEDTPEWRERDQEVIEGWHRAQGIVPELEGAKERLLARLEAHGGK